MAIPLDQLPGDLKYGGGLDLSNPVKQAKYDKLNQAYEQGGQGTTLAAPTSASQVPDYLKSFQDIAFKTLEAIPTEQELTEKITPTTPLPAPISRLDILERKREDLGVGDLETSLTDLKNEERQILATLREQRGIEEGKPVALGVIQGRIGEEERQAQTRLDFINVRKATAIDELNTAYNTINTYVQYAGLDYQDAVQAYESEFGRNLQVQKTLSGFREEAFGIVKGTVQILEKARQDRIDNARANLTTMVNAITGGNVVYDELPADQKLQIQKLEIQSGLPVGTISSMKEKVDPKADVVFTASNEGVTQIGFRNPDGTIRVESHGVRTPGKGSVTQQATQKKTEVFGEVQQELDRLGGSDKFVSPNEWNYLRQQWIAQGYTGKEFDDAFKTTYVGDPEERDFTSQAFGLEPLE